VISEAKFFAIHFQGNSRAAFCSIEQAASSGLRSNAAASGLGAHSIAGATSCASRITGAKKYDTLSAVQQRDN
jgi:hypothetical protein